jgi:hypothetical protein
MFMYTGLFFVAAWARDFWKLFCNQLVLTLSPVGGWWEQNSIELKFHYDFSIV